MTLAVSPSSKNTRQRIARTHDWKWWNAPHLRGNEWDEWIANDCVPLIEPKPHIERWAMKMSRTILAQYTKKTKEQIKWNSAQTKYYRSILYICTHRNEPTHIDICLMMIVTDVWIINMYFRLFSVTHLICVCFAIAIAVTAACFCWWCCSFVLSFSWCCCCCCGVAVLFRLTREDSLKHI